jgi:spectinomycin phosphotransferase
MKFEPDIDRCRLAEAIRQAYGYPVSTLTFFPAGMVGCHYLADCVDGRRYFVTLLTESHMGRQRRARLDFTLALTRRLYDSGLFPCQPAPHYTRAGGLKADFGSQPLVVYDYIEGHDLWHPWPPPPELLPALGSLTARLHLATAGLGLAVPYVERFRLPFERDLRTGLSELAGPADKLRPELEELRQMILPLREKLFGLLARLHELGRSARALNPPRVLVHTDLHGGNVIRTRQDELYVVDWEGAMLASAEHDLFIFAGEGFPALLAEYYRIYGSQRLRPELFAYYFHRRLLEDVAEFLVSLLHEDDTPEAWRYDFDLLASDCLSGLPFLEDCAGWAGEQLRLAAA